MTLPTNKSTQQTKLRLSSGTRIVGGRSRHVELVNGKIVRVYDDDYNLLEDRSASLGVILPHPPIQPKIMQVKKEEDVSLMSENVSQPQEDNKDNEQVEDDGPILKIPSLTKINNTEEDKQKEIQKLDEINIEQSKTEIKEETKDDTIIEQPKTEIKDETKEEIQKPEGPQIEPNTTGSDIVASVTTQDVKTPDITTYSPIKDQSKSSKLEEDNSKVVPKLTPVIDKLSNYPIEGINVKKQEEENKSQIESNILQSNIEPKIEQQKVESNIKPNIESKIDSNVKPNIEANIKPNIDSNIEPNIDSNIEPKIDTKIESKVNNNIIKKENDNKLSNDKKENSSMVEEILEEYKRNKWAEERDFRKNIEDMARISQDNKEKISDISDKLVGVDGKLGENKEKIVEVDDKIVNVEDKIKGLQDNLKERFGSLQDLQENLQKHLKDRIGDVKKPVSETLGELCTGVDCIKQDIKKSQDTQLDLEKKLDSRFSEIGDRIQKLEIPTFVCDNCGYDELRPLSSFCPNCGTPIYGWNDPETGNPVSGWAPYWKRRPMQVTQ